ncbi:unnamed protein product [Protopolystoma xenopodis]|uniref:Uncharacterized protein n=1 Tax=Protopolystoma xenopodis TaxID=117903 RepID=A0A3S5ADU0_9PLAT|nr:unnamed protein product [Protopolystoma xenopodis]
MTKDAILPEFDLLKVTPSYNSWGPSDIPEEFKDMPYQPFAKDARLGKRNRRGGPIGPGSSMASMQGGRKMGPGGARNMTERERHFMMSQAGGGGKRWTSSGAWNTNRGPGSRISFQGGFRSGFSGQGGRGGQGMGQSGSGGSGRQASVKIQESWPVKEEMDFARLAKLALPNVKEPEDMYVHN